ncbi:aldose epimerase [Paenibacillus tarimensis]
MSGYEINRFDDGYTMYELKEGSTDSFVRICPERGGIATELTLNGEPLFYLDRETFLDPQANIRGGNPILFPICGQLTDKKYEWEDQVFTMANHGVARTSRWEVVGTSERDEASITLRLHSNAETLPSYPFEFELLFTYVLRDGTLRLEQQYRNLSDRPMPMYAGFHPYFATNNKAIVYATDATKYLDYNDEKVKPIDGAIDLGGLVESVALLDANHPAISFDIREDCSVHMSYSEHFRYIVLWSAEGKPFVCVEPWMAKTNELNRKEELVTIEPNGQLNAWLAISVPIHSTYNN